MAVILGDAVAEARRDELVTASDAELAAKELDILA